jgi:hypothetical protein
MRRCRCTYRPGRGRDLMLIGTVRPEYPLVTPRRGLLIQAPGPAQMLKVPARNMDGTSPRSKCAKT